MKFSIRLLYLYLISFVGLFITVIGFIMLVDLGIKIYVFQNADRYEYFPSPSSVKYAPDGRELTQEEKEIEDMLQKERTENDQLRNRQRTVSSSMAMILVGIPLYLYHWRLAQKENRKTRQ